MGTPSRHGVAVLGVTSGVAAGPGRPSWCTVGGQFGALCNPTPSINRLIDQKHDSLRRISIRGGAVCALLEAITPSADSLWKRGLHPFGTRGGCAGLSRSPRARSWRQRAPGPLGCGQVNRDRTATPGLGRAHPLPFSSNPPAVPKTKSELSSVCSRWDLSPIWRGFRRNSVWGNFVNNSVWWGGGGVEGILPPLGWVRGG